MSPKGATAAASERELSAMERLLNLNRKVPVAPAAPRRPRPRPSGGEDDIRHLPLDRIAPNPAQPRRTFDDASIDELADSIRSRGVIQPILVRPHPEEADQYEIVVGERRFIAAGRAGLAAIPCMVRSLDDRDTFIVSVAENVAREDLNPIDEAAAYRRMLDDKYAANQGEIAQLIGVHRTRVSRKLKLLKLDSRVQDDVREQPSEAVSLTHLEELSRLEPGDEQYRLYRSVLDRGLSTRELHAQVEARLAPVAKREPGLSRSVIPLESGARIILYPDKYVLRVPRRPGDDIELARIVSDLEGVVAELKKRL